jgi:hypothetical protein
MKRALLAVVLLACAPGRAGRPCPAPAAPAAEAFASCGGMVYHTPPGNAVRYTIKLDNELGADTELADVCILLDGSPLFTAKDIEAAPKDVQWSGRMSYAQHRVLVQLVFKTKKSTMIVRAARNIAAIDGGALSIVAHAEAAGPAIKMKLPKDTPEPRCEY